MCHCMSLYPHSVFICFVRIWEQTAVISLYSINWLVCITETECVYCAVRTGSLYIILRSAHTVYLCVLCGSENKQGLFPYTALTDWSFYNQCRDCLLRSTSRIFKSDGYSFVLKGLIDWFPVRYELNFQSYFKIKLLNEGFESPRVSLRGPEFAYRSRPSEIFGGQSGTVTRFSRSVSALPCQ